MEKPIIREIRKEEYPLLKDMLYEAIFQPKDAKPLPRDIIQIPEISVYIDNFGNQEDDYCLVADLNSEIIGAVWVRLLAGKIKGYGNIDDKTPEFAISLFKEYRTLGYGTLLMNKMIEYLKKKKYTQASLSVDKNNYAIQMYLKLGFDVIRENDHDYIMLIKL